MIFLDTSAIVAFIVREEEHHSHAEAIAEQVAWDQLITTNLVVVEAVAVLDRKAGMSGVAAFLDVLLPLAKVEFVDRDLHARGMAAFRARPRSRLSLVDATSIEFCRDRGIREVFAFDEDFAHAGLTLLRG